MPPTGQHTILEQEGLEAIPVWNLFDHVVWIVMVVCRGLTAVHAAG